MTTRADLRPYGVPADFLGQAVHTTKDRNFRDTINIAVRPGAGGKGTIVKAFSTSNIVSRAASLPCADVPSAAVC